MLFLFLPIVGNALECHKCSEVIDELGNSVYGYTGCFDQSSNNQVECQANYCDVVLSATFTGGMATSIFCSVIFSD